MHIKRKFGFSAGFTLIELSISIAIIGLMLGGIVAIQNQKIRVAQRDELNRKLDVIGQALYNYRMLNNKLPCPANSSVAKSSADFGLQADGAAGACQTGSTANLSSNINTSGNDVFGGGVPVRTLGLADDYAFDPWGRRFSYYVAKEANDSANFTGIYGTQGVADGGKLEVGDESASAITDNILAVVFSHGPNGHGAFTSTGSRINASSTNSYETGNCMCQANGTAASPMPSSVTVYFRRSLPTASTDAASIFDDVGRFYNRAYFYTPAEKIK